MQPIFAFNNHLTKENMRWLPFIVLFGCPVEPKDIQDLSQNQGQQAGPGKQNQMVDGKPPGSPPKNRGEVVPLPPPNPNGTGETGPTKEATDATFQSGEAQTPQPAGNPDQPKANQVAGGDSPATGTNNPLQPGTLPIQSGEVPPNNDGSVLPPSTAGDVLPMYQQPPTFSDILGEDQGIKLTLTVSGATTFDFEFVVLREGEGRSFPKVIHKQSMATSPIEVNVPSNYKEPVWLIITADLTGDGPTPDDLVAGTEKELQFGNADFSLDYTLTANEQFLRNLPWFSQADEVPLNDGQ